MNNNGFTLIELLVVIAIIGILAGILFISIKPSEQIRKANTIKIVKEMLGIKNAVSFYVLDTGVFPNDCRLNCTEETDPFLSPQGVDGWAGPYLDKNGLWNKKHPWGGHLGLFLYDSNMNGQEEVWLIMDDDAPGTNASNNSGVIPLDALKDIDEKVDNGNLSNGDMFMGNSAPFASGEGAWRVYRVGEN